MAGASFPAGHSLIPAIERVGLTLEAERATRVMPFVTADPGGCFIMEEGLEKRGTTLTITFFPMKHGDDIIVRQRGATIVGQEDDDTELTDTIDIDYLVLATRAAENLVADQGLINFDILESRQTSAVRAASEVIEVSFMNQLAGYTVVNGLAAPNHPYGKSGCQACTQPDTAHHKFAGGAANEAAVAADTTAILTNRLVDQTIGQWRSLDHVLWPIVPGTSPLGEGYYLFADWEGMQQVKENNTDSDVYDLGRAAIEGGMAPELSTLVSGEGFKLNRVWYLESDYTTFGTSGAAAGATTQGTKLSNCKRACLFGNRALHVRYGEGFTDGVHIGYAEHQVLRRLTVMLDTVWGVNSVIVNSQRWGSGVLSYYSSAT